MDGMIVWSTPGATVGLFVQAGVIVAAPPYAEWTLGRDARELWSEGLRRGVDLTWLPRGER